MRLCLFPATPNTSRVRELRDLYWDVVVSKKQIACGFHDLEPMAEVQLRAGPDGLNWLGDVLVLSERGEFAIAVGRGLVLSVEADRLVLPEKKLDREARTLPLRTEGGHFLVYFEWGDEVKFRKVKGEKVSITSPGAEWPLMLFIAAGPSPALAETEMDRVKSVDMGSIVAVTHSFGKSQPRLQMDDAIDALWNHAHQLHRVNTYEPEPPFIYEWECPTRADGYASRVLGHTDTVHIVWDWLLVDATRARQEFENYLKSYDPGTSQLALDVAPTAEDIWPEGYRANDDGRCMVSSHPPIWPEIAWRLFLATGDRSWLAVTYEVAKLNIGWWERERDRDRDGLFEYADTRFPQPWESGCDGSPRFDELTSDGFACVDLNAQLVMFYRNLVRFALELGESDAAAEWAQRQDRLAHLVRERLWDADAGWFFDRRDGEFVRVRTTAALWTICAGIPNREQTDAMLEHLENPEEFATWFPLPSVAADEPTFSSVSWRGPCWPAHNLWFAMGLRHAGRTELAGWLIRRTLDVMAEVLRKEGAIFECYNPLGPDQDDLRLFDFHGAAEPVRRYYAGHAPVRAMVLSGLLGIEPTRDGLVIDPAEESLDKDTSVEFVIGGKLYTLEAHKKKEGLEVVLRRGRKTVETSYGKMLIPHGELP